MIKEYITTQGELNILDFLFRNKGNLYNMTEIAEGSGIHYETAKYSIAALLERDLIEKAVKSHKSFLFKLNTSHGLIMAMEYFFEGKEHIENMENNK